MYILITGLSLFWIGLEFESCGCFQIFNIISEFWWGQKNRVSFEKATFFFQRKWQKPSAFLLISVFFSDSRLSLVFFSIIFLPLHCFLSCSKAKKLIFLDILLCLRLTVFFKRSSYYFFHFLSFSCGKVSFSSTPGCGLYGISCNDYVSQVVDS